MMIHTHSLASRQALRKATKSVAAHAAAVAVPTSTKDGVFADYKATTALMFPG